MLRLEDCRLIGRIGKPHGHEGAVKLELLADLETDLNIEEPVFLLIEGKPVPFFMSSLNESSSPPILHFEDITGMEEARKLQGIEVFAHKDDITANHEWNSKQLIGFDAFYGDQALGKVLNVIQSGLQELLEFEINGHEVLVPLQDELIEDFDEPNKILRLLLPEGLLDLYLQ